MTFALRWPPAEPATGACGIVPQHAAARDGSVTRC